MHVRPHHHREQGPVDPPAPLQHRWEERVSGRDVNLRPVPLGHRPSGRPADRHDPLVEHLLAMSTRSGPTCARLVWPVTVTTGRCRTICEAHELRRRSPCCWRPARSAHLRPRTAGVVATLPERDRFERSVINPPSHPRPVAGSLRTAPTGCPRGLPFHDISYESSGSCPLMRSPRPRANARVAEPSEVDHAPPSCQPARGPFASARSKAIPLYEALGRSRRRGPDRRRHRHRRVDRALITT